MRFIEKHGKVVFQTFENYKYIKNINYSKAGTPKGSLKATMVEPASKFKLKSKYQFRLAFFVYNLHIFIFNH